MPNIENSTLHFSQGFSFSWRGEETEGRPRRSLHPKKLTVKDNYLKNAARPLTSTEVARDPKRSGARPQLSFPQKRSNGSCQRLLIKRLMQLAQLNTQCLTFDSTDVFYTKELSSFIDLYNLSNLIKTPTCHFKDSSTSIDIILTSKSRRFFNSNSYELGISDCHS